MRTRGLAVRAPLVALYALLLVMLAWHSSLASLLPFPVAPFPLGLYVWLALMLALLPAMLTAGSPLPVMLVAFVPAALLGAYDQSHLDWLRTLKDFDVVDPGAPRVTRLALAAAALLVAWATHAADLALRLRRRLVTRGVPPEEAEDAVGATVTRSAAAAVVATLGFLALVAVGVGAYALHGALGRVTFLMPVAAALLVALAAVLLAARGRGEAADEADARG